MTKKEFFKFKTWHKNLDDGQRKLINRMLGWCIVYPEFKHDKFTEYMVRSKFVEFERLKIEDDAITVFNGFPYTNKWITIPRKYIQRLKVSHFNN
jgi:hypothetical protein